jgi:AcrR family transcriptional regulator
MSPAAARTPDTKREAVLAAALELFGRYGYRRTSVDDIAREAGIAKGTVYLHVESKEVLFRSLSQSLLDRVLADAAGAAAGPGSIGDRLTAILAAKFGFFHEILRRSPHANELLDSKGKLCADVFAAGDAAYLQVLAKAIAAGTRRGELAPRQHGLSAVEAARLLMAAAQGLDGDPTRSLTTVEHRAQLAALVRVMVAGMAPR